MKQEFENYVSSQSNEWFTPPWLIDVAWLVMGTIDLDPASTWLANKIVLAPSFFTKEDDGLSRDWWGNVWLNPPRGKIGNQSSQFVWAQKMIEEYEAGRVEQGMILSKAALGYNWFETLWRKLPVCFLRERVEFLQPPDLEPVGKDKVGTCIFYVADPSRWDAFGRWMRQYGRVIFPDWY